MSHYCVAVISKTTDEEKIARLLEPYDEDNNVEFRNCTREVIKAWNARETEFGTTIDHSEYDNSIDNFADEYFGYESYKEEDVVKYGYWHNPKAKWDWYSIGGRWEDFLKLQRKDVEENTNDNADNIINIAKAEYTSVAKIKDIDFSLNAEKFKKAKRFWELCIEDQQPENEEEITIKESSVFCNKDAYISRYQNKINYAKSIASFSTFAVVTEDGWFEQGQMGWFGCSDENNEQYMNWINNYYDRFIKNADPESYITIVDCHI